MVNPWLRRALPAAPSVGTVLMRSMMANRQDFERRLRPEDLLLVPPFPADMGILDWHRHTELMDTTYRWALREVARLKAEGHPVVESAAAAGHPPRQSLAQETQA
jgi:NTE family protein